MAVLWASTYLKQDPSTLADLALAPLPTPDGTPFTLATGWSWALAGQDSQRRSLSVRLAEFLVANEFLATWTFEAGYLPPRVDALQGWQDAGLRKIIEQISYSAHLVPPADLISNLGPTLQQAVVNVLKAQSDPQTEAQSIIEQISQP
jgi:ABC-type glycerol-3-phosphate transport system substrate-binding protein